MGQISAPNRRPPVPSEKATGRCRLHPLWRAAPLRDDPSRDMIDLRTRQAMHGPAVTPHIRSKEGGDVEDGQGGP